MTWGKTFVVGVFVLFATAALAQGAGRLTPLVVGGEQYFKLEWHGVERAGVPEVEGSILNANGFPARKVRLLIDSLDAGGAVTAQTLAYVPGDLTPGARYHFETRVPARAAAYRVLVFQWEWIQAGGGDTRH